MMASMLWFSTQAAKKPKTAVVMLNMGGPPTLKDVHPFLHNLFTDKQLIQLPFPDILGPFIAKMRAPKVEKRYAEIGGGSPILHWTRLQGESMEKILDEISPSTAPHKHYVMFRYCRPLTEDCLDEMARDGVERAVAFSQYPHYSCTTSGSSLNHLWRTLKEKGMEKQFSWSIIDRWPTHKGYIESVAKKIHEGLTSKFSEADRSKAVILFSAHSIPQKVANRGDPYPVEIAATVHSVMQVLHQNYGYKNSYQLSYQSAVGPVGWLGPSTEKTIELLAHKNRKHILAVPIAFTSDHIETLHELDIEYAELARDKFGLDWQRSPSLNDDAHFTRALADIVKSHLHEQQVHSHQYKFNCPGCVNPDCRSILNPAH